MSVKHFIFAVILCQRNASESLELSRNCESERISQSICHKIPREWEITRGRQLKLTKILRKDEKTWDFCKPALRRNGFHSM